MWENRTWHELFDLVDNLTIPQVTVAGTVGPMTMTRVLPPVFWSILCVGARKYESACGGV